MSTKSTTAKAGAEKLAKATAAKPKKKAKPPVVKTTIQAPYRFTPTETEQMNGELRGKLDEIDAITEQAKNAAADFKLRKNTRDAEVRQLRHKLSSGEETRPMEVVVEFAPKRSMKQYLDPKTRELIREEQMQPADWQMPLFAENANNPHKPPTPTPAPAPPAKPPTTPAPAPGAKPKGKPGKKNAAGETIGKTKLGDVIDKAASLEGAQLLDLKLNDEMSHVDINRSFKKAAKAAQWTPAQTSLMSDLLRECETEGKMRETLAPHCRTEKPAGEPGPFGDETLPI